jgi:hypothetical protein
VNGLGGRLPPDPTVLVLTPRGANRVLGGVRVRRTTRPFSYSPLPLEHPTLSLVPVAGVPRSIADTALACTDLGTVRALVASAVQRGKARPDELVAELDAGPRNRSRLLRVALRDVLDGARSAAEAAASVKLGRAAVPRFELNVAVVDETGSVLYVVDVLWRELRAALEIDSREFHFRVSDWQATLERHNALTRWGLAVTHFPPSAVLNGSGRWLIEVTDWLRSRAEELGVPYVPGGGVLAPPPGGSKPFVVTGGSRSAS